MKEPEYQGVGGWCAWRVQAEPITKDHEAGIGLYLLFCPGAHLMWSYWVIAVYHLRDLEGFTPANKRFPEATHEIMFGALSPDVNPLVEEPHKWLHIQPYDLIKQIEVPTDTDALGIVQMCIKKIMTGKVSPDQDFRRYWEQSIDLTAVHIRQGLHPIQ